MAERTARGWSTIVSNITPVGFFFGSLPQGFVYALTCTTDRGRKRIHAPQIGTASAYDLDARL